MGALDRSWYHRLHVHGYHVQLRNKIHWLWVMNFRPYFQMLGIAGVLAIPGSIVVGWLDVKIGTKKTGILINVLAFVAVLCCLTHVTVLHYISLPILAVMLGGSSNLMVSCTAAIWERYDFKNAFSVIQPLNSVMTGVGITVVSACNSIDPTCQLAYIIMAVMAVIGLIAMCVLKVEPIDSEVR